MCFLSTSEVYQGSSRSDESLGVGGEQRANDFMAEFWVNLNGGHSKLDA